MTAATLHLPPDATVRLHLCPGQPFPHIVVVAAAGGHPTPEDIMGSASATAAMLTHDAEVAWPDRTGLALLAAVVERQGNVLLAFATLADAMAFEARFAREAQR